MPTSGKNMATLDDFMVNSLKNYPTSANFMAMPAYFMATPANFMVTLAFF